jgi:hypothetical protein
MHINRKCTSGLRDRDGCFLDDADREKGVANAIPVRRKMKKRWSLAHILKSPSPKPVQNRLMQKFACSLALIRQGKAGNKEKAKYEATFVRHNREESMAADETLSMTMVDLRMKMSTHGLLMIRIFEDRGAMERATKPGADGGGSASYHRQIQCS